MPILSSYKKTFNSSRTLSTMMLNPKSIDFEKLGFRAGLEVHHQIRSSRKLFCHCPATLGKDPENMDYSFYRYFRPVLGEMGDFDPGMLVEFEKGYKVIYYACERNTCTYEMDETPPFHPDLEAIKKGFVLASYFNCSALAEEIVVNRKQYLDGSITTGFQRTFIVGRDGWIPVKGKKVRVTNVYLEEDAARRVNWVDTADRTVYFNLDRLGVPLTEVITDHRDVETPEELLELAKQIGRVLRISHIGRRGLGVARQDVNLSIEGGNRVEVKGVQDLSSFDLFCRHEVTRQHALIEISTLMKQRKIRKGDFEHMYIDVSHLFHLRDEKKAFVTIFPKMKGLFGKEVQPNKDFGEEIFEKSMLIAGVPREDQFHSDEIEENAVRKRSEYRCGLTIDREKYSEICLATKSESDDAFILVVGPERKAMHAMKKIVERVKMALEGVPQETRRLLPSGNTEFLRVIHGKERIYPDTDTPPIVVPNELVVQSKDEVGKRPWEVADELCEKHNLRQSQVDLIIRDEKIEKFYEYVEKLHLKGATAYRLLVELPRSLRRRGLRIESDTMDQIAEELAGRRLTLPQVTALVKAISKEPKLSFTEALKRFQAQEVPETEIRNLVLEQLHHLRLDKIRSNESFRKHAIPKIVGAVLKSVKYRVEGDKVAKEAQSIIERKVRK